MTQRIQHRRYTTADASWPATAVMAGEVVVNPLRRALGVGDLDGTVRSIADLRPFDQRSQYLVGDLITNGGTIYRCKTAIGTPHAFTAAEWDKIGYTAAELQSLLDPRYSPINHNHDGVYSLVSHLHDDRYSQLSHNHDGRYSLTTHNHDGVYAKLNGGNNFGGGVNTFSDIVNLQGSYTAVYGNLSIAGGTGGFVPSAPLHVRSTGLLVARLQSTGAQQVRLQFDNPSRQYILYEESNGGLMSLYDLSGGAALQTWNAAGAGASSPGSTIFSNLTVNGALSVSGALSAASYGAINCTTIAASGAVSAPYLHGGTNDSGMLQCDGGGNLFHVRWDGTYAYLRIDGVEVGRIYTV